MLTDPAIIARTCGKASKTRRGWKCRCPAHEDSDPSCEIWQGEKAIRVRCYAGCDPALVIYALTALGFTVSEKRSRAEKLARASTITKKVYAADDDPIDVSHETLLYVARAMKLWDQGIPATGTAVEAYLAGRGLSLNGIDAASLRFHSWCPRGEGRQPAMLALMRDTVTGVPRAIHRTFLKRDGRRWIKDGKPMMFGPAHRTAVWLTPCAPALAVCEGIETALALVALGWPNVWALGSAGAVGMFSPLFNVAHLTVAADNDRAGREAADRCRANWIDAGWAATGIKPEHEGWDYADVLAALRRNQTQKVLHG